MFTGKELINMKKMEQLYEGKAKKVFKTDDENLYIVDYKDDATAFNGLKKGQIIYAVLAGIICSVIRLYGGYPEGCSYSILLANVMTPLIDKYVNNRVFGEVAK